RRKPIITLGYVIGRGTFFLIPFIRDPALFLALAIPSSMTFGISVPAMQALQADLTPKEVRGSIFGIQELFMNGGVLAGSILGGWLTQILASQTYHVTEFQIQGIALPFWITGALGALTTILFILHVKEPE
ncbi:MAG: MFS transporter, partial [Desulfurococcaceae archaeon]